jgi:hypothetical protein
MFILIRLILPANEGGSMDHLLKAILELSRRGTKLSLKRSEKPRLTTTPR